MPSRRALVLTLAGLVVIALAVAARRYAVPLVAIGTAYKAKILCSGVFISKRDPESILRTDLAADDLAVLRIANARVLPQSRSATADVLGMVRRTAVFRDGQGCAIVLQPATNTAAVSFRSSTAPSHGDELREAASARWRPVMDWAFSEPDASLPRRTRALVIVHKGMLVAEQYSEGITSETPLAGWSMTKSVMNALVGILVQEGKLALQERAPIPQWQNAGDRRADITVEHLLKMTSGLQFDEDYSNPLSDVMRMLLAEPDSAAYALAKPLAAVPDSRWSYSSGTTNILAYALRQRMEASQYLEFPRRALFDRIGMASAVLETDAAGTFVASSFMYATARDWARFGLLYLREGVWSGERLLPAGWVAYTRTPVAGGPGRQYGAHFWLAIPQAYRCGGNRRGLPDDAFHAVGHEGQFISIIPSRDLVVVRLGLTRYPCAWDHEEFLHRVLYTLGDG